MLMNRILLYQTFMKQDASQGAYRGTKQWRLDTKRTFTKSTQMIGRNDFLWYTQVAVVNQCQTHLYTEVVFMYMLQNLLTEQMLNQKVFDVLNVKHECSEPEFVWSCQQVSWTYGTT